MSSERVIVLARRGVFCGLEYGVIIVGMYQNSPEAGLGNDNFNNDW